MSQDAVLPALRRNLDFMPSPIEDRPGLLIRDTFGYSDAVLVIPPPLVAILQMFDGETTERDLKEQIYRATGELDTEPLIRHLEETLSSAGFLEDPVYFRLRAAAHEAFAQAGEREPAHAGTAYPEELPALTATFERYFAGAGRPRPGVTAIVAPHVSPEGGWESYRDAYAALPAEAGTRTFVILGTSHYGAGDRFGLTRKNYVTPLGAAKTDAALIDYLVKRAPDSIEMEDYCHAVEHSIEFQVLFLQRMFGPDIKVVPILCGAFVEALYEPGGRRPEANEEVRAFLEALGEYGERERDRLAWVMGIDMAHMGRRYGDPFTARADRDEMCAVAERDAGRMKAMREGDAAAFWDQVLENGDDLKWCGSSPVYTFLKTHPGAQGELLRYQQWNIDEQSVVSFGAMAFQGK